MSTLTREKIDKSLDWLDRFDIHLEEGGQASAANVAEIVQIARAGLARARDLDTLINSPELADFMKAVPLEAVHQVERWGAEHDEKKGPWDWFWALGYLGGKCAHANLAGDADKARHHCITIAALAFNWHRHIAGGQ